MVRLFRWLGFLVTVAMRAILGAAGNSGGAAPDGYGIQSFTSAGTEINITSRVGWVFTVGGSDLTVASLRVYTAGDASGTYRVMIHRNSDDAVMAQADIACTNEGAAQWFEQAVSSATLAASTAYTISSLRLSTGVNGFRNGSGFVMASELTLNNSGVFGSGDTRPTSNTGNDYRLYADFGFTV